MSDVTAHVLQAVWRAAGGDATLCSRVGYTGDGALPSAFAVSDFAAGAVAAASLAVAELTGAPSVTVDRRLASFWFAYSIKPEGWTVPPPWDPIAGDYRATDGWIRLHTNAPHHRAAALTVLGSAAAKDAVAAAVAKWQTDELEAAVVAAGGCAATMRSIDGWAAHAQGKAVAAEPLLWRETGDPSSTAATTIDPARPLAGVRVLDLTRVLAGPVATRFLAGFGAEVLRIDPPEWDEQAILPEVTLGKRCARLDLRQASDRARIKALLAGADMIVHGYRPGALDRLGLDAAERRRLRPGLIDVSLNAYGWTGPWAGRRGFDSLVQMSSGIAEAGMRRFGKDKPTPLPVQALDHGAGYVLAAAAIRGLIERRRTGLGSRWRTSLARVAGLLTTLPQSGDAPSLAKVTEADYGSSLENTGWGSARRMLPPLAIAGTTMYWDRPATPLGTSPPEW